MLSLMFDLFVFLILRLVAIFWQYPAGRYMWCRLMGFFFFCVCFGGGGGGGVKCWIYWNTFGAVPRIGHFRGFLSHEDGKAIWWCAIHAVYGWGGNSEHCQGQFLLLPLLWDRVVVYVASVWCLANGECRGFSLLDICREIAERCILNDFSCLLWFF